MLAVAMAQSFEWLPGAGAVLGTAGILCGALAVFLSGPSALIHACRWLALLGLAAGGVGAVMQLVGQGYRAAPSGRGGTGSLLASAGMVLLAFGAARVAERGRLARRRSRLGTRT